MKLNSFRLLIVALGALSLPAYGQGTAFIYQGSLNNGSGPANGSFDLTYAVFTNASGANQIGSTQTNLGVGVTNGLFAATVDFGSGIFTGPPRWLEIGVRTNGSLGGFTNLSPLQPLLAVPYAIMANSASNLLGPLSATQLSGPVVSANLSGTYGNAITLSNAANSLSGNGAGLVLLNANNLASGTVPLGRLSGITSNQLDALTWQLATNLNGGNAALASNVSSGISITNATITGSILAGNGGGLTNLNAGQLSSGVVPTSVLPGFQSSSNYATVGGGEGNFISPSYGFAATIGGGENNTNSGNAGTIAGGQNNTVGNNTVNNYQPTVGGGYGNQATNLYATVPGGANNVAGGEFSFAAGNEAQAVHKGAFVWADSQGPVFSSTGANQFLIRAQGGVGINTSNPNGTSLNVVGNRASGFGSPVSLFENQNTSAYSSPALRVLVDGGNPLDGALSVSSQIASTTEGLLAEFGNASSFVVQITNNGTVYATGFVGEGSGLTGVSASSVGNGLISTTELDGVAINTNLYITAHPLLLRGDNGGDHNHGLAYCGNGVTNFPNPSVQPDGPVLWGFTGGVLGVLNGGAQAILSWNNTGVNVSGALSATSISGNGVVAWQSTSATSVQAASNTGYMLTSGAQATVTLPASPSVADIVRVSGAGSGGWKIAQNSGQQILGGFSNGGQTTLGTAGSLTGGQTAVVELQYIGIGEFIPLSQEGTIVVH